jgi:hypothetical protein
MSAKPAAPAMTKEKAEEWIDEMSTSHVRYLENYLTEYFKLDMDNRITDPLSNQNPLEELCRRARKLTVACKAPLTRKASRSGKKKRPVAKSTKYQWPPLPKDDEARRLKVKPSKEELTAGKAAMAAKWPPKPKTTGTCRTGRATKSRRLLMTSSTRPVGISTSSMSSRLPTSSPANTECTEPTETCPPRNK